jgi:hypothetical protein
MVGVECLSQEAGCTTKLMLKLLRQLRGGVNQLLLCLNNIMSIKTFFNLLQVAIKIIQDMNNINNKHQSHI